VRCGDRRADDQGPYDQPRDDASVELERNSGWELAVVIELERNSGWELAVVIACGIGLHNFSEGLAIGNSAASGELSLALLLIIGFGLHNATEGFGIVAPLAGEPRATLL
jgi:zinc transporter, ZIP family